MTRLAFRATLHALPLVVVVGLAACVGPGAASSDSPLPVSPSSTIPAVDPGPVPRIDADCERLVDLGALQALVGTAGAPLSPVPAGLLNPDEAAVLQLGGLECQWTNGLDGSYWAGPDPAAQTVALRVLPEGLEQAAEYVDLYRIADPTYGDHVQGPRCGAPPNAEYTGFCELYGAIGATWVELMVFGIVADPGADAALLDGFRRVTDPMVEQLQPLIPGPRWTVPATSGVTECETVLPSEEAEEITGMDGIHIGLMWDGPRVSQYFYATEQTGAKRCSLAFGDREGGYGAVHVLPGGAWGFDRYRDAWLAAGADEQTITGLPAGAATLQCEDAADQCRLDLRVAGDWVRIVFPPAPENDIDYLPDLDFHAARAAIVPLAEAVVANISAAAPPTAPAA